MMKIKLLVLCVVYVSATYTYGQAGNSHSGISGGLNVNGLRTDNILIVQNKAKMGWQIGMFTRSALRGWGYHAEANIITLGSKQVFGDESQRNTVGYLRLPIALQYATSSDWSFLLGGYASFRLWATRKSTKVGVGDFKANIKDNVAFMDYGVWVGVVYTYKYFIFDLRYQQGIPNINTNSTINARASNISGQISIGYFLN
jgi:Outer membrane protein beta-barrel domain